MVGGPYFRDSVQGKSHSAKVTFVQRPGQSEQWDRGTVHAVGTRTKAPWKEPRNSAAWPLCLQWTDIPERQAAREEVGKGQGKALNFNLEAIRRLSFSLIKYYNVTPLCICMHFSEIYREIPYIFYPVSLKGNILQSYSPISKPRD